MNPAWKAAASSPNWSWRFSLRRKGKINVCFYCFTFFEDAGDCPLCGRKLDAFIRPWKKEEKSAEKPVEKPPEKPKPEETMSLFSTHRKEDP